jgi:hypothetical protein
MGAVAPVIWGVSASATAAVSHQREFAGLPMSHATYVRMMAQIPLDRAADKVQRAAARPGKGHAGFFETWVDPDHHTMTVVWNGRVPADIQRLIGQLRRTVKVDIVSARYSLARLTGALAQATREPGVVGGYPLSDGSGLHLDVRVSAQGRSLAPAASVLRARFGVPVLTAASGEVKQQSCVPNSADTLGAGSRCDDLSPGFWGGDVILQTSIPGYTAYCTGGFGGHDSSGNTYMITAAHCAQTSVPGAPAVYSNGVTFYNGYKNQTMGNITDVPGTDDGAVIPASTGDRYYDGPGIFAGDTKNTKTVVGQQGTSKNDMLCESGSFGGVICGMRVTSLGYSANGFNNMALVTSTTGNYSVGGDSGGPWFSLAGTGTVTAKGIHHGITTDLSGNPTGELYTPINLISDDTGVTVNTG